MSLLSLLSDQSDHQLKGRQGLPWRKQLRPSGGYRRTASFQTAMLIKGLRARYSATVNECMWLRRFWY
jgi:hypothetical protein